MDSLDKADYHLQPGHELRLEVEWGKRVYVTLKGGSAEVFGTSLDLGDRVTLGGVKVAIYTWQGAHLEVEGRPDVIYESDETPMQSYLNVHDTLEARRQAAQAAGQEGPRTFAPRATDLAATLASPSRLAGCLQVVGPTDSGKSTLCKILLNYAVRTGWHPVMADLDIGQGSITVPGCLAATPIEAPIDVEEGFPVDAPLVYYFGGVSPSDNPALYKHLVERLAHVLDLRAQADATARAAGLVINSMGWVEDLGYELLRHTIQARGLRRGRAGHALKVDVVVVVGDERLYSQLSNELRHQKGLSCVKLSKSGGVVTRSRELRQQARKLRVEEYFFGVLKELSPASQTAPLEELQVYRVGGGPKAPTSALPIGATSVADPLKLSRVPNAQDLAYSLVAVSHAPAAELLLSVNVAGFIYIQDVDLAKGTVSYLAPCPGPLPGSFLLAGNFKVYLD
ncbi:hypothetical protein N2152v2_009358 [Parachlorella kessleri]